MVGTWPALLLLSLSLLAGCSGPAPIPTPHGPAPATDPAAAELAQTSIERLATLTMRANLDSLYAIMRKLYRRNPAEWKKGGFASASAAALQVRDAVEQQRDWPPLHGERDIRGLALALSPAFTGDRVAALTYAAADMLITANGGRIRFYLPDRIEPQYLYNGARNIEIMVWMLAHRRDPKGHLLLLADEISEQGRNLSFEREYGKIIGRLDLLSLVAGERYRRAAISYVHGLFAVEFLQFLPVR